MPHPAQLPHRLLIVTEEGVGGPMALVAVSSQVAESIDPHSEARLHSIPVNILNPLIQEFIGFRPSCNTGENPELGEVFSCGLQDSTDLVSTVDGNDHESGLFRSRGLQQVVPGCVSVKHLQAELPKRLNSIRSCDAHRRAA